MSANSLIQPLNVTNPNVWTKIASNSLSTNSANLNNGPIANVSTINGLPVPSGNLSANTANLIYRPGSGPHSPGSNIYDNWVSLLAQVNTTYINQTINIYIDDSIISPCLITASQDCSRITFKAASFNISASNKMQIVDGITLINPRFQGPVLFCYCDSITTPSIQINGSTGIILEQGCFIGPTASALVPPIQIADNNGAVIGLFEGCNLDNSLNPGLSVVQLGVNSVLILEYLLETSGAPASGIVSSVDNTSTLLIGVDSTVDPTAILLPSFTGTIMYLYLSAASNVSYNDSTLPHTGSNTVQGAIDYVKSHGVTFPLLSTVDGTAANPAYSFQDQPSTGLYQDSPQSMTFTAGGTDVLTINGSNVFIRNGQGIVGQNISAAGQFLGANASGGNPEYSFTSDNTSGMYLITPTSDMRLAVGGTDILQLTPSLTNVVNGGLGVLGGDLDMHTHNIANVTNINGSPYPPPGVTFPLLAPDGSNTNPSYSFSSSSNTGLWYSGGFFNISVQGATPIQIKSNKFQCETECFLNTNPITGVYDISAAPNPFRIQIKDSLGNPQIQVGQNNNIVEIFNQLQVDGNVGFYNATPISQPTASGASGYASVGGTPVLSNDTFTGGVGSTAYSIGDIVKCLKQLNLIAN